MTTAEPVTELDARYSVDGAEPTAWRDARRVVEEAKIFWLATVRPDGRPHVTSLIAVWLDGAAYFSTGPDERKARNLAANTSCVLTTGCNDMDDGLDVVLEGDAQQVVDDERLREVAAAYVSKYGDDWAFDVRDGAFAHGGGGRVLVFELAPTKGFGFGKGSFSQTRWSF